jgi:hypothetical protein
MGEFRVDRATEFALELRHRLVAEPIAPIAPRIFAGAASAMRAQLTRKSGELRL